MLEFAFLSASVASLALAGVACLKQKCACQAASVTPRR